MKFTKIAIFATLLTMATATFAATQQTNQNNVSPTLQVNATVVDAVQLTLAPGTLVTTCGVAAGSGTDFKMDFGTVDALAINSGLCGNRYTPAQTGSDAVYYTDYQLKPVFTSQPNIVNPTITAIVSTNFTAANIKIVRDSANSATAPAAGGFTAMATSGAPDTIASAVASGTPITRYIGVDINGNNGANLTGPQAATVTFTLTVN